jgi:hypothetical protein
MEVSMSQVSKTITTLVTILGLLAGFYGLDAYFARQSDLASAKTELSFRLETQADKITTNIEHKEQQVAAVMEDIRKEAGQYHHIQQKNYWQQRLEHLQLQREYYYARWKKNVEEQDTDSDWWKDQLNKTEKNIERALKNLDDLDKKRLE